MISWILGLDAVIVLCLAWTPHVNATCPFGDYSKDDCGVDSYKAFGGTSCPCQPGLCCSKAGKCGPANSSLADQTLFCGAGCQSRYGACIFVRSPSCPEHLALVPNDTFLGITAAPPTFGPSGIDITSRPTQRCCSLDSPIVSWNISLTADLADLPPGYIGSNIGRITATCQDGSVLPGVSYGLGFETNTTCKTTGRVKDSQIVPATSSYNLTRGLVMESFLGIGKPDTDPVSFACPSKADGSLADQVAIGFQAQSSCEGLTRFKVLCIAAVSV